MSKKIKVIPCSGMGKVFGLAAREAALKAVDELVPDEAETLCLAYVMTGDEAAKDKIEGYDCITLDGCPALCAAKSAAICGGIVKEEYRVVDAFKKHRGIKAGGATTLTEDGWMVVDEIAAQIADKVKELGKEA